MQREIWKLINIDRNCWKSYWINRSIQAEKSKLNLIVLWFQILNLICKELIERYMEISILANSKMIWWMDLGSINGILAKYTMANGKMVKCMEKVSFSGMMANIIKETMSMMRDMVKESWFGISFEDIEAFGPLGFGMDMVNQYKWMSLMWIMHKLNKSV